jgi:hypothetical protein
MPRGVPKAGFRKTKNTLIKQAVGVHKPQLAVVPMTRPVETDSQIREKLSERFAAMDKMADATLSGINKALIISGPAGLGKSYGVMKLADKYEKEGNQVTTIKGFVRPTGLYKKLYENRYPHCVLIFDDADAIFMDDIAMNLLKGACDMTRRRTISWLAETKMEDEDGERVPTQFDFEGRIIFITNMDFDSFIARGTRLGPHFEAMISRSIYLDLAMHTRRDYMMRIQMVVEEGMLDQLGMNATDAKELLKFIDMNCERLRELSLRMVIKLANIMKMDRKDWQRLARVTCMKSA